MTKQIELTQGKVALVDDEDYEELSRSKWHAYRSRRTWYARRNIRHENGKRSTITMHLQIVGVASGMQVDRKDGDGLNNSRDNLRLCTSQQNHFNRKSHRNTSSQYKGVAWDCTNNRWRAMIMLDGKNRMLGRFLSEEAAALAYDAAARQLFGEFARCNFSTINLGLGDNLAP